MFLILRKSCLTENTFNRALTFISKWVEYVLLFVFLSCEENNEFREEINRISNNCLWKCRYKFTLFKKYKKVHFFIWVFYTTWVVYFINHKTKDYFLESAGLLNLSVSTLKE